MISINEQQFLETLSTQSKFGRLPPEEGGGLNRPSLSIGNREVCDYFCRQAEAASLDVAFDGAANLSAKLKSANPDARTIILGSHLDSVPNGGSLDGSLGVFAALEVLRTITGNKIELPVHLEALSFTDEEGRWSDLFGSRALAGKHTVSTVEACLAQAAQFPEDLAAMRKIVPGGLTPQAVLTAKRPPGSIAGFLELHIEQGPQLEHAGIPIGVVDSIFGRRSLAIQFFGRSDHAGTTPMHLRADSLVAAAEFIIQAPQIIKKQFPNCVLTCGNVIAKPGAYNVIPEETTVWVEFRASTQAKLKHINEMVTDLVKRITATPEISFSIKKHDYQEPVAMDNAVQAIVNETCKKLGYPCMTLSSGALHDAVLMSTVAPTGLIFVASKDGRSHCPDEDTGTQDLIAGANVLLHSTLALALGK